MLKKKKTKKEDSKPEVKEITIEEKVAAIIEDLNELAPSPQNLKVNKLK